MNKLENVHTLGFLQPLPIPIALFTYISMDFINGLPKTEGNEVIFVVVDCFSKYAHFLALSHPYTNSLVVKSFKDNIYKLHGVPTTIISVKDPIFLNQFLKKLFSHQEWIFNILQLTTLGQVDK
jgi:hypothetical protein